MTSVPITTLVEGSSTEILLGTGVTRTGGVERILEYNGVQFNRRDWIDTFLITSIDGLGDPDLRDSRENNPSRDGETYFKAFYGGRSITISGVIRAHTLAKMRDMEMGLKQIFRDISQEQPLYFRASDPALDLFINCKKSQPIVMGETQESYAFTRSFQIGLRASNPRFLSNIQEIISFSPVWQELIQPFGDNSIIGLNYDWNGQAKAEGNAPTTWGGSVVLGNGLPTDTTGFTKSPNANVTFGSPLFASGRAFNFSGTTPTNANSIRISHTPIAAPTPGQSYKWSVSFVPASPAASGTQFVNVGVLFKQSSGASITPVQSYSFSTNSLGGRFTTTMKTPSNATYAEFFIDVSSNAGRSYNFYFGDSIIEEVTDLPSGFSDFTPNYFWDGDSPFGRWGGSAARMSGVGSLSVLYDSNGLEGTYTFDTPNALFYLDTSDGWIKPLSGIKSPRSVYRSDIATIFADLQATIHIKTGTNVGSPGSTIGRLGLIMKRIDANNFLYLSLQPTGTSTILNFWTVNSGVESNLGVSSTFILEPSTEYWLRGRVSGNDIAIELFQSDPATGGVLWKSYTFTMTGSTATKFGAGVTGSFGVRQEMPVSGGSGLPSYTCQDYYWKSLDIDEVVIDPITVFNAVNEGNAPAQPVFKLYGPISSPTSGGAAIRLSITRTAIDGTEYTQAMTLNAKVGSTLALASGHYFLVDSDRRIIQEYDATTNNFIGNSYNQLDMDSDWFELDPGDNPLKIQMYAASAKPTLEMSYRHTYF